MTNPRQDDPGWLANLLSEFIAFMITFGLVFLAAAASSAAIVWLGTWTLRAIRWEP